MALNQAAHERVSAAIRAAEAHTSGEIFCVFTEAADEHRVVPLAYAALFALVLPPLLVWFGLAEPGWMRWGTWTAEDGAAPWHFAALDAALSAVLFAATYLIVSIPALRYRLAPPSLRRAAVDRAAMESFLSHGIHVTDERTGVLIFLSRADRQAEIVADEGIYARVDAEIWGDAVEAMLAEARSGRIDEAFVQAVERVGAVLAAHFPPRADNPNELPDRLIEI